MRMIRGAVLPPLGHENEGEWFSVVTAYKITTQTRNVQICISSLAKREEIQLRQNGCTPKCSPTAG
jgi:hypothetical protein